MDLVVYAIPFFIMAMLAELAYGVIVGRNTYRLNDSASSLFLGVLSQARRFVTLGAGAYVYHLVTEYFSLPLMATDSWFTWVFAMVLYDFCYYWLHRLGHERTILWAAHVAHHQSEDYNLSTALRQTSTGFLFGWIFYTPLFVIGFPLEVLVTVNAVNDPPLNSVPAPQATDEDTPLVFNAGGGNLISISDVDAGGSPVEVTLNGTNGLITLNGTTGLTFSTGDGSDDPTLVFTGSAQFAAVSVLDDGGRLETGEFVLVLEDMAPAEQGDQITGCSVAEAEAAVLRKPRRDTGLRVVIVISV